MPIEILMPALSPTMEKGTLAKWLKKEGDLVQPGDVLAEIETDKATMEVESIDEGRLGKIMVAEGTEDVLVNTVIAVLLEEGEGDDALAPVSAGKGKPAPSKTEQKPEKTETKEVKAPRAPNKTGGPSGVARVFATPLARRLARDGGVVLEEITGSGPHGRIIAADVRDALAHGGGRAVPAQGPQGAPSSAAVSRGGGEVFKIYPPDSYELVPHDGMRKVIAERLTMAKSTIPHFYLEVSCCLRTLLEVRERLNSQAPLGENQKPLWKLSVNDFIVKALGRALKVVPDANVSWSEDGMLRHKACDVGVAVAIPGGLITPVVRDVDQKGLVEVSKDVKAFAARARDRKLLPHEYQGGGTSVSNLGMYGIASFAAVINPPQATILAVGAAEDRVVSEGGEVVVRPMVTLTLSVDHRAVDGVVGASFLGAIKAALEEPSLLLL